LVLTSGAEDDGDPLGKAASQALELELGQLFRVHGDPAFGTAEGDVHERRFPCHDGREAQHLIVVGVRVVPDAAFAGTARPVVLDAVPGEHLDPAVVHANGHFHLDLAERAHEDAPHVRVEIDEIGSALELTLDDGLPRHRGARRSAGCGQWTSGV